MGGCYGTTYGYSNCSKTSRGNYKSSLNKFVNNKNLEDLVKAYKDFFLTNESGFIAKLAEQTGIKEVRDIPKEFPETEYEVKFDIQPYSEYKLTEKEPEVIQYLDAFDFPTAKKARFLKDPINNFSIGINNFIGDDSDEKLVIIEKAGNIYLKEKGLVEPTDVGVDFEEIVIKRKEERYQSSFEQAMEKANELTKQKGVKYRGKIRKEKGDAFVLDSNDGRIYSFTITRAHLIKPGQEKESGIQRQLELEYAGYIPGFKGFKKDSEKQIVQGMVDLAKYTYGLYNDAPIEDDDWRMKLHLTGERKYDFINQKKQEKALPFPKKMFSVSTIRIVENAE
jgi:hypothetical protein